MACGGDASASDTRLTSQSSRPALGGTVRRSRLHATPATACVTSLGKLATHLTPRVAALADAGANALDAAAGGVASAGRGPLTGGFKCEANEAADDCKRSDDPLPKLTTGTFTSLRFRDGCPDNGRCLTSELASCAAVRVAGLCDARRACFGKNICEVKCDSPAATRKCRHRQTGGGTTAGL